ncbi:MAG: hypothetical protein Ct9H300mP1_12500 [Planctomycetaceae bacterium]|nr:MAG: hypothetical protein Ct9H300mP1_12500 [Planctomycetaceae bacterium]
MFAAPPSVDHRRRSLPQPTRIGMPTFEARVALATTAEQLFDYIVHPAPLAGIMPPETPLEVIESPERLELVALVVDLDGFGPTQRLTYEVTALKSPCRYRDDVSGHWVPGCTSGDLPGEELVDLGRGSEFRTTVRPRRLAVARPRIEPRSPGIAHGHRRCGNFWRRSDVRGTIARSPDARRLLPPPEETGPVGPREKRARDMATMVALLGLVLVAGG